MCILFTYTSTKDDDGDYSLIIASNRDEKYDRPALKLRPWEDDPHVLGGRDVQAGGTWFALSLQNKKLGVLLNVPGAETNDPKSRGRLVTDFVKGNKNTKEYVNSMASYIKECHGFVLATVDFEKPNVIVQAYYNIGDNLITYGEGCHGFGNCDPTKPLKKVKAGNEKFSKICKKFNKVDQKDQLIEGLLSLLKSDERTHTLVLVTKSGHVDVIEFNMVAPIDPLKPNWDVTNYAFGIKY